MSQQQLYIRDIAMFEITNGPRPLNATAPRNPVIPARTVVLADTKATVATAAARICSCLEPISAETQLTLSAIIPWKTVLHKSFRSQCQQFPRKLLHLVSHRRLPRFPRQVKDPPFPPLPASTSISQEDTSLSSPSTTRRLLQRRRTRMIPWNMKTTRTEPYLTLTRRR